MVLTNIEVLAVFVAPFLAVPVKQPVFSETAWGDGVKDDLVGVTETSPRRNTR